MNDFIESTDNLKTLLTYLQKDIIAESRKGKFFILTEVRSNQLQPGVAYLYPRKRQKTIRAISLKQRPKLTHFNFVQIFCNQRKKLTEGYRVARLFETKVRFLYILLLHSLHKQW